MPTMYADALLMRQPCAYLGYTLMQSRQVGMHWQKYYTPIQKDGHKPQNTYLGGAQVAGSKINQSQLQAPH